MNYNKNSIYYDKYKKYKTKYLSLQNKQSNTQINIHSTKEGNMTNKTTLNIEKNSEIVKKFEDKLSIDLNKILEKYDLSKYYFTKKIILKAFGVPHSHPKLTLTSRYLRNKDNPSDELLSNFIHEQLHWYLENNKDKEIKLIEILKKKYPNLKIELPFGARGEYSTYLHIIINFLEYNALNKFIGVKKAKDIVKKKPYYTDIYKLVVNSYNDILKLIKEYKLLI